jgi:hypothetical protein
VPAADPRAHLLERSGFARVSDSMDRVAVYACTRTSFRYTGLTTIPQNEQSAVHA